MTNRNLALALMIVGLCSLAISATIARAGNSGEKISPIELLLSIKSLVREVDSSAQVLFKEDNEVVSLSLLTCRDFLYHYQC